jgi:oxaloacetate decarboxylase (Na+ extruding) subunit gamma
VVLFCYKKPADLQKIAIFTGYAFCNYVYIPLILTEGDEKMEGIILMVIGMATVFAFLVLLILAVNLSAAFFQKFSHLFPERASIPVAPKPAADLDAEVAVVLAAIKAKRG